MLSAKYVRQAAAFALGLMVGWCLVKLLTYEVDQEALAARLLMETQTVRSESRESEAMSREIPKEVHLDLTNPVIEEIVESHRRAFAAAPSRPPVYLMVLIKSFPGNRKRRDTLRTSWFIRDKETHRPVPNRLTRQFFLIGDADPENDKLLQEEMSEYDDIIRVPFAEEFSLLAPKTLYGLQQAISRFTFQYLLVANQDILVNWQTFFPWLAASPSRNFYAGSPVQSMKVPRDQSAKFYVPEKVYSANEYPPMANGYGYVMSSDVVYRILAIADKEAVVGADDAMVGLLASRLGISVTPVSGFREATACSEKFPMLLSGLSSEEIQKRHKNGLQRVAVC